MKKLTAFLLSAVLCLSMLAAFPCFTEEQLNDPIPYTVDGKDDDF